MTSESVTEEEYIDSDLGSLNLSKRIARSMSQKFKRKEASEESDATSISSRCLPLYGRGGGCRIGAEIGEETDHPPGRRSGGEDCKRYGKVYDFDDKVKFDCFSYGMRQRLFRRSSRKILTYTGGAPDFNNFNINARLPDDVLEMCLVRLPLAALMNARLVCKKWRSLASTPRFLQTRREGAFQTPWLFLLGAVKNGVCSGEMHVLDVSMEKWHKIESPSLKGRFLFSVASFQDDIYIVGGCSSLANTYRVDRNSCKTHKGVVVFTPLNKSWRKAASMKYPRSLPVLGTAEVDQNCFIFRKSQPERRLYRARINGASDVYEDPHRYSVRRQSRHSFDESDVSLFSTSKPGKLMKQKNGALTLKDGKKFVMIAVGGLGSWDEPLDTGEIYDPVSNKWTEIQRLPLDFGRACTGVVCRAVFYVYSESDKLIGYDMERGYWIQVQTVSSSPARVQEYYPKLVASNGGLFMLCVMWCEGEGQIGRRNKAVRKLWELDFDQTSWKEVSRHPDAPMDWNAAFVGDKGLVFGVEIFKIFGRVLDFVTVYDEARGWRHVCRNNAQDLDASSCITKALAVLHL